MEAEQKVEPLEGDLAAHTEKQREWVRGHFIEEARGEYETIEGKLRLLDTIITSRWIKPDETWKLQSLGITFGDALAQMLNLEWVRVTDEYGVNPALRYPGTTILVHPLTAISKRIEDGDEVDARELFGLFCDRLEHLARNGPPDEDGPMKSETH
jgi:hypothetical protein